MPPGVPLHYPEHEAIAVFGNAEEYEAAKRGDPVPRFRARLVTEGALSAEEADSIAEAAREGDPGGRRLRAREPVPGAREGRRVRLRVRRGGTETMARELPADRRDRRGVHQEMGATRRSLLRPEPWSRRRGPVLLRRSALIGSGDADLGDGGDRDGGRGVSPATAWLFKLYTAELMLVAMDQVVNEAPRFYGMTGGQVKAPIVLQAGWGSPRLGGQHTGPMRACSWACRA